MNFLRRLRTNHADTLARKAAAITGIQATADEAVAEVVASRARAAEALSIAATFRSLGDPLGETRALRVADLETARAARYHDIAAAAYAALALA